MDDLDRKILDLLECGGRMTASEIGKRVNLSVPAAAERIRKLEDRGIVKGYQAVLDRKKIGKSLSAFVFVDVEKTGQIEEFRRKAALFPDVLELHHIAGEHDYLLKVAVKDTSELEGFITDKLKAIPGVSRSRTYIVFSSIKETSNGKDFS